MKGRETILSLSVTRWKRIAVIVQKANAGVILGKLKRITGGRGDGVMGEELDVKCKCSVH